MAAGIVNILVMSPFVPRSVPGTNPACPWDKLGFEPLCKIRRKPRFVPGTNPAGPSPGQPDWKVYVYVPFSCRRFHRTSDGPAIRNANQDDSRESIRREKPIFFNVWAIRANRLKPTIRKCLVPKRDSQGGGVQLGNPETIRENQAIRAHLRIDSRESGHQSTVQLKWSRVAPAGSLKAPLLPDLLSRDKETRGVRARYDAVLLPSISVVWSPSRPVMTAPDKISVFRMCFWAGPFPPTFFPHSSSPLFPTSGPVSSLTPFPLSTTPFNPPLFWLPENQNAQMSIKSFCPSKLRPPPPEEKCEFWGFSADLYSFSSFGPFFWGGGEANFADKTFLSKLRFRYPYDLGTLP